MSDNLAWPNLIHHTKNMGFMVMSLKNVTRLYFLTCSVKKDVIDFLTEKATMFCKQFHTQISDYVFTCNNSHTIFKIKTIHDAEKIKHISQTHLEIFSYWKRKSLIGIFSSLFCLFAWNQTEFHLVPNQSGNSKYNLIPVDLRKITEGYE